MFSLYRYHIFKQKNISISIYPGTILHYLYDRDHTAIAKFKEDKKNKAALDGLDVDTCHVYETANGDIKLVTGCSDFSLKRYDVKTGIWKLICCVMNYVVSIRLNCRFSEYLCFIYLFFLRFAS